MRAFTIVILISAACGKSSDRAAPERPATVTDAMVATAERYVDLMGKLAGDLEAAHGDCKKATAALRARGAEAEAIRPDVEALTKIADDAAAAAWFDATYSPRMKTVGMRLKPVVEACHADAEFGAAMEANLLVPRKKRVSN